MRQERKEPGSAYSAARSLTARRARNGWRAEGFLCEARTASALNHPGIVTVYEVMQSETGLAIVMELVEGESVRELCSTPNPIDVGIQGSASG